MASLPSGTFFFEPFEFHLEASDLLVQLGFLPLELTQGLVAVALEEAGALVQQLRFPLADLIGVDASVAAQLGQCLAAPACGPLVGLAASRATLNLYSALYCRRFGDVAQTLHVCKMIPIFYTLARGPILGVNHTLYTRPCPRTRRAPVAHSAGA